MRTNTTKAKLAEGKVVFGAIISRYAPDLVELFGAIGYDFVMIDCEHGPMDLDQVEHMVRAAEVFGITPITRIPNHADSTILQYLDRGVQGIIVPHVNTRETAVSVARAARYHPDGHRGVGGGRAHDYGVGGNSPSDSAGVAEFIKLGANFVTISALGLLRLGAEDFRRRVQAAL